MWTAFRAIYTLFFPVRTEVIEVWVSHSGPAGGKGLPGCYVVWSGKYLRTSGRILVPSGPSSHEDGACIALS